MFDTDNDYYNDFVDSFYSRPSTFNKKQKNMAWNYSGNNNGGYSRAPYSNNYGNAPRSNYGGRGGYQRQQSAPKKKHSGAKYVASTKNGNPVISAWNYSRRLGLVNVLIAPYKNSSVSTSKTGRSWAVWMAKITGKGINEHFPVLVDMASKKAVLKQYGWVVNPSAANGGYCGQFGK